MRRATAAVLLVLAACSGGKPEAGGKDIGQQAADVASDTAVLREANAAAGEVVRNAADCEVVRGLLGETNRKLEEADRNVRTVTGRATLDALKKRVATVADACP